MLINQMKNYQSFKHVIMLSLAIVCAFFYCKLYEINVEFGAAYVVKHYCEPIYVLDNPNDIPEYSQYKLHHCETKYGRFYSSTETKSKNYPG